MRSAIATGQSVCLNEDKYGDPYQDAHDGTLVPTLIFTGQKVDEDGYNRGCCDGEYCPSEVHRAIQAQARDNHSASVLLE